MRLSLCEFRNGVETPGGDRVVYDVERDQAFFGSGSAAGRALVWQLEREEAPMPDGALLAREVHLDPLADWIARCDRVEFPKGGVAYRHTHPGPGIRYLLHGELEVVSEAGSELHGPGAAWFESGPDPVLAISSKDVETAFVRVMLLPSEWAGKRTIRYVDPADESKPKLQRATVYLEHAIHL